MTAVRVLDSSTPPTAAQVAAAKAAGWGAWLGYIGRAGDNLLDPWSQADFQTVTAGGLRTGAYCSGVDDPAWVKATAAERGVPVVILDVEYGIRGDGPWVPGWCAAAGAGLYGGPQVMRAHASDPAIPFLVLSAYPNTGGQTATWSVAETGISPSKPTGWQWAGTRTLFGVSVDLSNFDPAILAPDPPDPPDPPQEVDMLNIIVRQPDGACWLLANGKAVGITNGPDLEALKQAGIQVANVSQPLCAAMVAAFGG